jgi:glutamate-5-semialdehyde dehydrogenase
MTELTREMLNSGKVLIPYGGNRVTQVPAAVAGAFQNGDRLVVVQETGAVLHIPAKVQAIADAAVDRAHSAFEQMGSISDQQITRFFEAFAERLEDAATWDEIAKANVLDIMFAEDHGRSTTRLKADDKMRRGMIEGLRGWAAMSAVRDRTLDRIEHEGWSVEQLTAPLGVVAFVFEGRPNVFADATGVLRSGNTVVFRIGSDALRTAQAIVQYALGPALDSAGLPRGAVSLVESPERSAGWAMFSNRRLALAVARGSGAAVAQLGAVARQAGVPVSLHGTGGAWLVAAPDADAARFAAVVEASLDRKVCNTLNVCCIDWNRAEDLVPLFLDALHRAGEQRGHGFKLHVVKGDETYLPANCLDLTTVVRRADGDIEERLVELLPEDQLGHEWEWEGTPEVSLRIVRSVKHAIDLFNRYSPQFDASLISEDASAHEAFYQAINAPFVGDGFTRWVDGQYALDKPELGLSNWEHGRLFARGGVLSGDGVFTVRTRVRQTDPGLRR